MNIIKELRKKHGMSQRELADACLVHQTAVSQWENGRTDPDLNSLKMLARVFGVSVECLLGYERPPEDNLIPAFRHVNAETLASKAGNNDYFALLVPDSSMSPTLMQGDTAIISLWEAPAGSDVAAVCIGGADAILRRIIKKGTSVLLVPDSPSYEPIVFSYTEFDSVRVLGRVDELRRKF